MNQFLAEMYGTNELVGATDSSDDISKLAEARVLDEMLEAEGINIDQLPDETIVKMAYQIFGDDSALVKMAMDEEDETPEHEAKESKDEEEEESEEEKVAEADMLGRIMAHSFHQESHDIEKQAKKVLTRIIPEVVGGGTAVAGKGKGVLGRVGDKLKAMKGSYKSGKHDPGKTYKSGRSGGEITYEAGAKGGAKRLLKEHPKTMAGITGAAGLTAGAGAGAGLAALAGKKGKKKEGSALDALAEQRALEMLKEAGVDIGDGYNEEEKLATAVEERAFEMLAEAGYLE